MNVILGVSNRHVHLTEETYKKLFKDEKLEAVKYLRQPGQFASNKFVTIKNGDRTIEKVRILGPFRDYDQVEISKTDSYHLKLNPPIRSSGDIKDSEQITLATDYASVHLNEGCIIANRHIHLTKEDMVKYNLKNKVKILIKGEKGGIIDNVYLKVADNSLFELHLDTDDGNAFNLKTGDILEILEDE